jgi:hypothetical protein
MPQQNIAAVIAAVDSKYSRKRNMIPRPFDVDERRMTFDQVAGSYASLVDAAMTVSRIESYFFLSLSGDAGGELVGDSDELMPTAKSSDARAAHERLCRHARETCALCYRIAKEMRRLRKAKRVRNPFSISKQKAEFPPEAHLSISRPHTKERPGK